jgi:chaperone required for assembly of F1-ATPase
MRDIFEDIFSDPPLDPVEAARRSVRPMLRKRFYRDASVGPAGDGGFPVLLDGKPVRTPARRPLAAPSAALAAALAAEWQAQAEVIDPATMPLTRLANSIIDGVADVADSVRAEVVRFIGSDLILYRAERPEALVERQAELWDPVLGWLRDVHGARFVLAEGVMHVAQPDGAVAAAAALIPSEPWRLGAVHAITTLTGSGLLALAVAHGTLTPDVTWTAAHVDEDWNLAQWGDDPLARESRAFREAEMRAAGTVLERA